MTNDDKDPEESPAVDLGLAVVLGQLRYDLHYYLRWRTSVPTKLNEFAILVIGRLWRSQVDWFAHAPLPAKAGLSPDIIADLKAENRPGNMAEDEALVHDFVAELTTTQKARLVSFASPLCRCGRDG